MKIKAERKFIRSSPRKINLVAGLVRSLPAAKALTVLTHTRQRSAQVLLKTLKQAIANAVNNHNLSRDSLLIQSIEVNQGPIYKRWQPIARGQPHSIKKRTSHIKIILESNPPKADKHGAKS